MRLLTFFTLFIMAMLSESCYDPCGDGGTFGLVLFRVNFDLHTSREYFEPINVNSIDSEEAVYNLFLSKRSFSFRPFEKSENDVILDSLITHEYLITLRDRRLLYDSISGQSENKIIVDTLRMEYRSKSVDDRCYDKEFSTLNFYYNGLKISNLTNHRRQSVYLQALAL